MLIAEADSFVAMWKDLKLPDGRDRVVRHVQLTVRFVHGNKMRTRGPGVKPLGVVSTRGEGRALRDLGFTRMSQGQVVGKPGPVPIYRVPKIAADPKGTGQNGEGSTRRNQ